MTAASGLGRKGHAGWPSSGRTHQIAALNLTVGLGFIEVIRVLGFLRLTWLSAVRFGFGHPLQQGGHLFPG
jgi:hypothetical protein